MAFLATGVLKLMQSTTDLIEKISGTPEIGHLSPPGRWMARRARLAHGRLLLRAALDHRNVMAAHAPSAAINSS